MKIDLSYLKVLLLLLCCNLIYCKFGNNLQTNLGFESGASYGDDTVSYGIANNGGYYLPDNAVSSNIIILCYRVISFLDILKKLTRI